MRKAKQTQSQCDVYKFCIFIGFSFCCFSTHFVIFLWLINRWFSTDNDNFETYFQISQLGFMRTMVLMKIEPWENYIATHTRKWKLFEAKTQNKGKLRKVFYWNFFFSSSKKLQLTGKCKLWSWSMDSRLLSVALPLSSVKSSVEVVLRQFPIIYLTTKFGN